MDTHIIETREFNWKVHNFTKKLLKTDKKVFSDDFSIFLETEETEWYFCIKTVDAQCGVYLYLRECETDDFFTVKFEVFVRQLTNQKSSIYYHLLRTRNEFNIGDGWGCPTLIPIDKICRNAHKYLKGNTLTIGLKVELVKKKDPLLVNPQSNNQYLNMCKKYFNTKLFSDFTIVCSDGIEIPAHKFILAGFSPVMERMINIKMTGSRANSVNIKDINGETMNEILRFIYTSEVNNIKELAIKLYYGAEKYELNQLKKMCITSMIKNLTVDNALDYFLLAEKYSIKALLFRSAVFIKLNYTTLRAKNWSKFSNKQFLTLMDNYQHIPGEVDVLESTF